MSLLRLLSIILITNLLYATDTIAEDIAQHVFSHIDKKNWYHALAESKKGDSVLSKIVLSQQFLDGNYKDNRFQDVIDFIKANPKWPQIERIKEKAESYLTPKTDKRIVFEWFRHNRPKTGQGYKYYAFAAASILKDKEYLAKIVKEGWIYGDFTRSEEAQYLEKLGKMLSKADHVKRIEEHLWKNDIDEATRSLHLVGDERKKAFHVAILAIQKSDNTDSAFAKLTQKEYIPVTLYHYLDYRKKKQTDDLTLKLFSLLPQGVPHENEWAKLALYYAREFIDQKNFAASYEVVSKHFASDKECLCDCELLAGFLSLRFLKHPSIALSHFNTFVKTAKRPISKAKGQYWIGRTYAAMGQKEKADAHYKQASKYSFTFYGQMALLERGIHELHLPHKPKIDTSHKDSIEKNELMRATKLLIKFGKPHLAHIYAKSAIELASNRGEIALIGEIIKAQGNNYYAVEFAKNATSHDVFLPDIGYPTPYNLKNSPIEPGLAYAIIRQESVFNKAAISHKDAMGLMQLIKPTACAVAKITNDRCDVKRLTSDPQYNIKLGTNYLSQLIKEREGSYILAIPSYNTYGGNVTKWLKRFGDPRELKDRHQVIDWLELVPFGETRNYLQRVLEALQVYRVIINKDHSLKLDKDLMRGSKVLEVKKKTT